MTELTNCVYLFIVFRIGHLLSVSYPRFTVHHKLSIKPWADFLLWDCQTWSKLDLNWPCQLETDSLTNFWDGDYLSLKKMCLSFSTSEMTIVFNWQHKSLFLSQPLPSNHLASFWHVTNTFHVPYSSRQIMSCPKCFLLLVNILLHLETSHITEEIYFGTASCVEMSIRLLYRKVIIILYVCQHNFLFTFMHLHLILYKVTYKRGTCNLSKSQQY